MRGYVNQSTGDTYLLSSNSRLTEASAVTANKHDNSLGITLESIKITTYQDGRSLIIAHKGKCQFSYWVHNKLILIISVFIFART